MSLLDNTELEEYIPEDNVPLDKGEIVQYTITDIINDQEREKENNNYPQVLEHHLNILWEIAYEEGKRSTK